MCYIDLHETLDSWPYDSEQISVRKIVGVDGAVRIQMRVELGVLQMEVSGRPDGMRPHGCASLLEYFRHRLARYEQRNGTTLGFVLSPKQCQAVREEASLYYRRYVALFVLEEYAQVVPDTLHNLAIFDLCREYALQADDRECLESFRPYVLMMNARAQALQALEEEEHASALAHVNRGLLQIRAHYEERGELEAMEHSEEVKMLRSLAVDLTRQMPNDSLVRTCQALRAALEREQFEEAARLRDVLKARFDYKV